MNNFTHFIQKIKFCILYDYYECTKSCYLERVNYTLFGMDDLFLFFKKYLFSKKRCYENISRLFSLKKIVITHDTKYHSQHTQLHIYH